MVTTGGDLTEPIYDPEARFVTVLRASAAIRLPPDKSYEYRRVDGDGLWNLSFRTRYIRHAEGEMLPRELWVEVVGPGTSLQDAMHQAMGHANVGASVLSLAMNAAIEPLQIELCFHASSERPDHPFFQNFILDETGYPRFARVLQTEPLNALLTALTSHDKSDYLFRAIGQYELALRAFTPGYETLAMAHLWMAIEALTPVAQLEAFARTGLNRDGLAAHWGIKRKDLTDEIRCRYLFQGERQVYELAKKARNEFQHGVGEFDTVRTVSAQVRDRLAVLVRHAIFELADVSIECKAAFLTPNFDVVVPASRVSKYVRCTLVGDVDDLAPRGSQYPAFQLESGIKSVRTTSEGIVTFTPKERVTPMFGARVQARDLRFEAWGPPGVTVERDAGDDSGELAKQPSAEDLLAAVMPLVDATIHNHDGEALIQDLPRRITSVLFAQGTTFFESGALLLRSGLVLEALPMLHGLVTMAARLEAMTEPGGVGLGLAIRLAAGGDDDPQGGAAEPVVEVGEHQESQRNDFLEAAKQLELSLPDTAPSPEQSRIWQSLALELNLARRVMNVDYAIVGPHLRPDAEGSTYFDAKVAPGPLNELVASAFVIAELELLRHAASILGLCVDLDRLDERVHEARELNDRAAAAL